MAYIPLIQYVFILPSPMQAGRHDKGTEFMLRRYAFPLILLASIAPLAGCSPTGSTADTATETAATLTLGNDATSFTDNDSAINDALASNEVDANAAGNDLDLNAATAR